MTLTTRKETTIDAIRHDVLAGLDFQKVQERQFSRQTCKLIFDVAWSPLDFLREQKCEDGEDQEIGKVITLNGSAINAQAITCAQCMHQTWPTTGVESLRALEAAIAEESTGIYSCIKPPVQVSPQSAKRW